jgi:succinate-acetate transporter protein
MPRAAPRGGQPENAGSSGAAPTRGFLQPIAAPSILGLFRFAGATSMVAAHMAGWYGSTQSGTYLFPFAAMFGGLAQFAAGMWAYWETAAGWILVASSFLAAYTAGAMMIAGACGRTILPLGEYRKAANVPGKRPIHTLEYEFGEPGVK